MPSSLVREMGPTLKNDPELFEMTLRLIPSSMRANEDFIFLFLQEMGAKAQKHLYKNLLGGCPADQIPAEWVRQKSIKTGSQLDCQGSIEMDESKKICRELNSRRPNGVEFRESAITEPKVGGGTCSAMAFDFAARYLQHRRVLPPQFAIEQITVDDWQMSGYERSSPTFRIRQAAFNTISKTQEASSDFKRDKIDAMVHLHNLSVVNALEEIDMSQPDAAVKFAEVLETSGNGVFVLRVLKPDTNEKEEAHGHSAILIHEDEIEPHFYDPCDGLHEIERPFEAMTLAKICGVWEQRWQTNQVRLYQIR